jgi:nucleoid-associated protein YgaU
VKREATFLIAVALLVNSSPMAWGQDEELNDQDLQTLLDDKKSTESESKEVLEPSAATSEVTPAPETTAEPIAEESNEVQDLAPVEPVETAETAESATTPETAVAPTEAEPSDTLESLEPSSEAATVASPSDDLDTLKTDLEDDQEFKPAKDTAKTETEETEATTTATTTEKKESAEPAVFDVGREERDLLSVAKNIQGQISDNEWNEVATASKVDSYTVVKNDWLFKISKKVFGSGFYYPKIWSINSYITNPHFIEPGMVLSFTTGSGANPPQVKLGEFTTSELDAVPGSIGNTNADD